MWHPKHAWKHLASAERNLATKIRDDAKLGFRSRKVNLLTLNAEHLSPSRLKASKHNKLGPTRFLDPPITNQRRVHNQCLLVFEPSFMGRNKTVAFFLWKMLLLAAQIGRRGVCYQSHGWRSLQAKSTFIPQVVI